MALNLPIMQKKKTSADINTEIDQLKYELRKKEGQLKTDKQLVMQQLQSRNPYIARMYDYGLAKVTTNKKGAIEDVSGQESFEKYQHRIVPTEFPSPSRRFRLELGF